jgi:hypothetical protein
LIPRAEQPPAGVFRVLDRPAAQHADFGAPIEQREIDCGLEAGDRRFVLGVEKARIADRQHGGLAGALQADAGKVELAGTIELCETRARIGARQQHRMAQVHSRALVGEDVREEKTLVDLEAVLVALQIA